MLTSTGIGERSTSSENVASVTVIGVCCLLMVPLVSIVGSLAMSVGLDPNGYVNTMQNKSNIACLLLSG
jgi:hypothetical protein